jgi:hypothetical protein
MAIIIALIIGLVIIAVIANILQQQKEKQDAERRQEMVKYKTIVEDTELIIANDANVPITRNGFIILHRRVLYALKKMNSTTPGNKDIHARIKDCTGKIEASDFRVLDAATLKIPEAEKPLIALIQGIKKYRVILRSEHTKGNLTAPAFMEEDKKIELLQLRINVESQMRRGSKAKANGMTGSARQYYEKALATLNAQTYSNDYIAAAKQKATKALADIASQMSAARSVKAETDEDGDNLDALFAPKKKW